MFPNVHECGPNEGFSSYHMATKKVCCNLVKCEKQCHLFTRFYAKHLVQDKLELVGLQSDLFVATLVKRRTQR